LLRLWDIAIAPIIRAADAKRVVEIGAWRGDTTVLLLDLLGPDAQIDVIDPEPEFDPAEHEKRFRGTYRFHRDTSHNVLPQLGPVDVALIDGDHNWYTVHGELEALRQTAREAGAFPPVILLHDVGWPYGRRDLYYDPGRIPGESRQPYGRAGLLPGQEGLVESAGINAGLDNAAVEGGPRNGVMTALDDFLAEHDRPVRRVTLPIDFGLAIVVDQERLAAQPALAEALDRLESAECRYELLELSESLRIYELVEKAGMIARYDVHSLKRLAKKYLGMLKGALLNEHDIETEARLDYLVSCQTLGMPLDWARLRDPAYHLRGELWQLENTKRSGMTPPADGTEAPYFPYAAMGEIRLDHLERCLDTIRGASIDGDLVDCGVGRGGGAIFMRGYLEAYQLPGRQVWAADRFANPAQLAPDANGVANQIADLNMVRAGFERFDLLDGRVRFLQGPIAETLADAPIERVALLRVDGALVKSPGESLEALYDKVTMGGFVVVDGCDVPGCLESVDAFRERRGIEEPMERVDDRAVYWRKPHSAVAATVGSPAKAEGHAPLAPPLPEAPCQLSVVVVVHNMRREAERTLHSLSRSYQRGIDELDYEVVVVENGSDEGQKLGAELVRSYGSQFRYLDLEEEATPSPAQALNRGIERARGEVFALMVDGAHVLTPGVLHYGMFGVRNHAPAIVATQQWHVGPGQQASTIHEGYDRDYEDGLMTAIGWPRDGYRLFEIGHFIGVRDWLDGMWESNCLFVPRQLLEQVGGMDEAFWMPGGGFTNLDLYERLTATPGVNVVSILGEASFHQVHGGTTTNQADADAPLIPSYRDHYAALRHRPYRWTGKKLNYVGSMTEAALRTRTRRRGATQFSFTPYADQIDERPTRPVPLPEELQAEFTDAYWRSFRWQETSWLGHRVAKPPSDLFAYQELIVDGAPDWVIETPSDGGGRALFLASICELVGHGRVLSIDQHPHDDRPEHPRLTYVTGDPLDDEIVKLVRKRVGEPANAMLFFGLANRAWLRRAFDLYAPLVPVGSGVVFEDTVMNGFPVWPAMGPGPAEAAREILTDSPEFDRDPRMARLTPSFNEGGYLRRLR
jgi:cephalosporin hydroxylase